VTADEIAVTGTTTTDAGLAGGRYRVERTLGSGGMATVFLARDRDLDRLVAVKVLADHLAANAAFRRRFVREATLAARLQHPNVVTVFDAGEDGERPFIVMEYVEGETLADVLRRRGRLPPEEALGLARQAADGLAHAHAAGLVHRDVKPQNLLLRSDGTLKVADFGIARSAELTQLTELGTVLGTAGYLAPEQAAGGEVTAATDVYALGVVVYELLTGRRPYAVGSLAELGRAHAGEPVVPVRELVPDVSPATEAALMRALALRPEYRPASAAELAAELEADGPRPPVAARPGPRPRSRRWAIAAAVLVAAGVLAGVLWTAEEEPPPRTPPPRVEPVAPGATPEQGARNLAEWLRRRAAD
jgi:serine/threonine-protein kinase